MEDKELADAVKDLLNISPFDDFPVDAAMVRNWKYAGALMEKMDGELLIWLQKYSGRTDVWIIEPERQDADARNESLPRAIIEACVKALAAVDKPKCQHCAGDRTKPHTNCILR